jgi:hypothetical protein
MPDTIQSNPNAIDLSSDIDVWQRPTVFDEKNPAVQALDEYMQHQYAEQLVAPDVESVNAYEAVPARGELTGYATNQGVVIDPQNAEAVLAAATHAVDNAFGATPEMLAAAADRENRERQNVAVTQAGVYAPRVEDMRDGALASWGMPGSDSLN